MRRQQILYSLCPVAEKVILDRVGHCASGIDFPSQSLVLNANLRRHDAGMCSLERRPLKKYNPDELPAFEAWTASLSDAQLQLSMFNTPNHTVQFRELVERDADREGPSVLDTHRRHILMRILQINFYAPEMCSLTDRLCLNLARRAKKGMSDVEREGQGG